jgi:hypothetical protein
LIFPTSMYDRRDIPGLTITQAGREKPLLHKGKGDPCCAGSEHRTCFGSARRGGFVGRLGRCRAALVRLRNRRRWDELLCCSCCHPESDRALNA